MKSPLPSRRLVFAAGLLVFASSIAPSAFAQLNSSPASVTLTATLPESLTVSATPNNVTFALAAGQTAAGNVPVEIVTTWILGTNRTSVVLNSYFSSATAALTDGAPTPDNIPSSDVFGQLSTGIPTTNTPYTQTISGFGAAGAALALFNQPIAAGNYSAFRTDFLNLSIALPATSNSPTPGAGLILPAGAYTGTLTFMAQAN
jgi:hypothetical protein